MDLSDGFNLLMRNINAFHEISGKKKKKLLLKSASVQCVMAKIQVLVWELPVINLCIP